MIIAVISLDFANVFQKFEGHGLHARLPCICALDFLYTFFHVFFMTVLKNKIIVSILAKTKFLCLLKN